jgi:D-sedoheptulose 7-phosphate isomerase
MDDGVNEYLEGVSRAVAQTSRQEIENVVSMLFDAWKSDATIFIFGNGGSASTASHMATDLNKQASVAGVRRLRALALTDNMGLVTAWANDSSFKTVFAEQMANFLKAGDVAVGISTSGESPNVIEAIRFAKAHDARTIALTGPRASTLSGLVDLCIYGPADDIGQQEDLHLILNHTITGAIRRRILKDSGQPDTNATRT